MVISPQSKGLLVLLTLTCGLIAFLALDRAYWYGLVGTAFVAGGIVLLLWRRNDVSVGHVLAFALLFRVLMVALPPTLSDDAYRYVWDGLVQQEGINPYRYTPNDPALAPLHEEPIYAPLNSKTYYTVYPPVSQAIFAFGAQFYSSGWLTSFYIIKGVLFLFEVAALLVLSRIVEARSLMLYAWNPLVLIETAGQAHTESALVFFLVLTLVLARQRRGGWAAVMLACAGWVKLYPFVLFPFLWRRFGWRAVWPGGLAALLLALPYAAPYVAGHLLASVDLYARLFEYNAGFYYGLKEIARLFTGQDWSKIIGPALRAIFLLGLPVLYVLDARRRWSLPRAFLITLGFFLVCATTIHPWYLLGPLLLTVWMPRPAWHWHWLGLVSLGTYLFYIGGPYGPFVIIGWGGWLIIAGRKHGPAALQGLQRLRARSKLAFIARYIPRWKQPLRVIDIGAGEGYVGAALTDHYRAQTTLVDVLPMNCTSLPHVLYEGHTLPFEGNTFDLAVLYFVLHHTEDPRQVVREALRVSPSRVVVVESVVEGTWDRRLLRTLDRLANRLRSGGRMRQQEQHVHFRQVSEWRQLFISEGAEIIAERRKGRWIHKQAVFVLSIGKHTV